MILDNYEQVIMVKQDVWKEVMDKVRHYNISAGLDIENPKDVAIKSGVDKLLIKWLTLSFKIMIDKEARKKLDEQIEIFKSNCQEID